MFSDDIRRLATAVLAEYEFSGLTLTTAESCTGGLLVAALTDIPGSSSVVERGFVTYSNAAKTEMLGVPASLINAHGAVSAQVCAAMAVGALNHSRADVSVAITGIAGPGGATETKPVGRVFIATSVKRGPTKHKEFTFKGDRSDVRLQTVIEALKRLKTARPNRSES
jgi:nicotinamide-nucleotide amidase